MKIPRIKLLRLPRVIMALMFATLAAPAAAPVAHAESGPAIAIFKDMCLDIGQQNTCNGRDTSLNMYKIDFKVYAGFIDQAAKDNVPSSSDPLVVQNVSTVVDSVTVTLGDNSDGKGNIGNGSQGRKFGTALLTVGSPYTVCEVPSAYSTTLTPSPVGLVPTPRPNQSTGGVNQTNAAGLNASCIQVTPTKGKAEAKFLDKKAEQPPCQVNCPVGGQASVTTYLHTGPKPDPTPGTDTNTFPCSLIDIPGCDPSLVVGFPPHVPLGTNMRDDALVDSLSDFPIPANSTLDFYFYTNYSDACPTSVTALSSTDPNHNTIGGNFVVTVFSPNTGALHAGSYAFQANFISSSPNQGTDPTAVTDKLGDCEPFVVDKGTAAISTLVHNETHTDITSTTVQLGSTVHDIATATGSYASFVPTGTVDFNRYGDNSLNQAAGTGLNCAGNATAAGTGALGADPGSSSFGPLYAGSYGFKAGNYSGDSDYLADSSFGACEPFGVAKSGALTMGFWQNKNGQGIIGGGTTTGTVCNSGTWLRQYAPFQDLSPTASCSAVKTYVYNVIKAANASGASMNAMLKAQMLATALDVYFSDPSLGGNKINAAFPIGGLTIVLTNICKPVDNPLTGTAICSLTIPTEDTSSSFNNMSPQTVNALLAWAASQSNLGGSVWYGQVKNGPNSQELAKDTFDAINNQLVA